MQYLLEVWNRTNTTRLARAVAPFSLQRHRVLLGEETLRAAVPMEDSLLEQLGTGAVLRIQEAGNAAAFSLWRLSSPVRQLSEDDARVALIEADALWMDFRHGLLRQIQADGRVLTEFGLVGLTPTEWLTEIILPGSDADAIGFQLGTVEPADPVDLDFSRTSPLEALRMLEERSGAEAQFRLDASGTFYRVDLLERVGNASGGAEFRYRKNIRGAELVTDESEVVTRLYAFGADGLSLADAEWIAQNISGTAGARELWFSVNDFIPEDDAHVGLWFYIDGKGAYPITRSDAQDGYLVVDDTSLPAVADSDVGYIAVDEDGTRATFVELPSGVEDYGVRVGVAEYPDIPNVSNLVRNADLSAWNAGLPEHWSKVAGSETVVESSDALYARQGRRAAHVTAAAADQGLITDPFDIVEGDARRPYLGISAGLTIVSGYVRLELRHSNGRAYPLDEQPSNTVAGVHETLSAAPVSTEPLPAGTAQLAIVAHGGAAEFYLDSALASPAAGQDLGDFIPGDGAVYLWQDAVAELERLARPRLEYRLDVIDLHAADPEAFPFDRIDLGDDVTVRHPDLSPTAQRVVEVTEDLLQADTTRVVLAPSARERPTDVFRPSIRRMGRQRTVGRPRTRRAQILHVSETWDPVTGMLHLAALANEFTAALELRTKTDAANPWPAGATETEADRQGVFAPIAIAEGESVFYQVIGYDARGVPGEPFESSYSRVTNLEQELADVEAAVSDLDAYINGAFEDGVVEAAEAKAIRANLRELEAEKEDVGAHYATVIANPRLTGTPASDLTSAYGTYDAAHQALVASIEAAIVPDADGVARATAAEAAQVDAGFATYRAALADLTGALQEALDAIRDNEGAVVAPTAAVYKQVEGSSANRTSMAVHLTGANEGGTLSIWSNPNGLASRDPEVDPADGTVAVGAGVGLRIITSADSTALQNVLANPRETKFVYVEFVTAGGRSSGIQGFPIRSFTESIDPDTGLLDPDVPLSDGKGVFRKALPETPDDADAIPPSVARDFVAPAYVDGGKRPFRLRDATLGVDIEGETINEGVDRSIDALEPGGVVKTTAKLGVGGREISVVEAQATSPTQNLLGPDAGPERSGAGGGAYRFLGFGASASPLAALGLTVGDVVSVSADLRSGGATSPFLRVRFWDDAGTQIGAAFDTNSGTSPSYVRRFRNDITVPASATRMGVDLWETSGTETVYVRRAMLNRGPVALPFEEPPLRPNRETADDVAGGATKTFVAPTHVDVNYRPIKLRDDIAGVDYEGVDVGEATDRSIAGLDASGNVKRDVPTARVKYDDGTGIETLKPAEAGAETTAGKSLSVLADRTADNISESATKKWAAESGADKTAGKDLSVLSGRTADKISYPGGATVAAKEPAEAGAEKTAGKSLDILADGTTYKRTTADEKTGGGRAYETITAPNVISPDAGIEGTNGQVRVINRGRAVVSGVHGATGTFPTGTFLNPPVSVGRGGVVHQPEAKWGTDPDTFGTSAFDTTKAVRADRQLIVDGNNWTIRARLVQKTSTITKRTHAAGDYDLDTEGEAVARVLSAANFGVAAPAYDDTYYAQYRVSLNITYDPTKPLPGLSSIKVALDTRPSGGLWTERATRSYSISAEQLDGNETLTWESEELSAVVAGLTSTSEIRLRVYDIVQGSGASLTVDVQDRSFTSDDFYYHTSSGTNLYASMTPDAEDVVTFDCWEAA